MNRNQEIAAEILRQLGGNRFLAMTGAHSLVAGEAGLIMSVPGGRRGRKVLIMLDASDTYTVKVLTMDATYRVNTAFSASDIYCDQLRDAFTQATGLDVSL